MKALLTTLLAASLAACNVMPTIERGEDAEVVGDNLHRVDNARLKAAYVDPDVDFAQYKKVLITPLDMSSTEIIQPSGLRGSREWKLTDKDRQVLAERYQQAMEKRFTDSGRENPMALVNAPGEDVLLVTAGILQLAPAGPKDDIASRGYSGRSVVFTEGAGAVTIAMIVKDSATDKELIRIVDKREGWSGMRRNTSVSNLADVNHMLVYWANRLKSGIDALANQTP